MTETQLRRHPHSPSLRILIADDHAVVRFGLRTILSNEEGWQVCGEAADGQAATAQSALLKPNLVILDIHMPVRNGWKRLG